MPIIANRINLGNLLHGCCHCWYLPAFWSNPTSFWVPMLHLTDWQESALLYSRQCWNEMLKDRFKTVSSSLIRQQCMIMKMKCQRLLVCKMRPFCNNTQISIIILLITICSSLYGLIHEAIQMFSRRLVFTLICNLCTAKLKIGPLAKQNILSNLLSIYLRWYARLSKLVPYEMILSVSMTGTYRNTAEAIEILHSPIYKFWNLE